MFIEPNFHLKPGTGWIEVICGSMFSGKTEELMRRINRAKYAKQEVITFKPSVDDRYHKQHIVSHNANQMHSIPVENSAELLKKAIEKEVDLVGIDEVQFFDEGIVDVCNELANRGMRVIVAGLDMDYKGKPFGPMPFLLAIAEFVTKLHAICMKSGELANYSYRIVASADQVVLGETEAYEARSRRHFFGLDDKKEEKILIEENQNIDK